jgi:DNA-binding GntR family transcriptional regulator
VKATAEAARTSVDRTTDFLRRMILDGTLAGGQQLRQTEIANGLGISRTPLREAIARLQAEGLVVNEPHRGATVFRPSTRDLAQIYDIRLLLEPRAVELATPQITLEKLRKLEEFYERLDSCLPWEFAELNRRFHLEIYREARQERLQDLITTLRHQSDPYIALHIGGAGNYRAQEEHRMILDAIRAGDAEAAAERTASHLQSTLDAVRALLEHRVDQPHAVKGDGDGELVHAALSAPEADSPE